MRLDAGILRGMPRGRAELYGKPHLGARYTGARSYEAVSGRCAICGRPTGSVHHAAHRSWGLTFDLVTQKGTWRLRSPLFALCGSGTTGCHDLFHGGAGLRAEWRWRSEEAEEAWWTGELLAGIEPHSPDLFRYGFWAISDRYGDEIIREGGIR